MKPTLFLELTSGKEVEASFLSPFQPDDNEVNLLLAKNNEKRTYLLSEVCYILMNEIPEQKIPPQKTAPTDDELEELERFALGVGLSLALTPLVGFVLNYTPWGIRLDPITVAISLLTLVFGLIGVYRKYQYHMLFLELTEAG